MSALRDDTFHGPTDVHTARTMPNRIIRESMLTSATLYRLSDPAERLCWRLVVVADDFGRFEADPQIIKAKCFPLWPDKRLPLTRIVTTYAELEAADMVRTYIVGGKKYGFFVTWEKYQHRRATTSKFPEPTEENLIPAAANACVQMLAYSPEKREARSEESRSEESGAGRAPRPAKVQFKIPDSIATALDKAPSIGKDHRVHRPEFWQAQVRANPGVDYAAEVIRAEAWIQANPERAPRARVSAFLARWLARASRNDA
jgi:hypothetical protein